MSLQSNNCSIAGLSGVVQALQSLPRVLPSTSVLNISNAGLNPVDSLLHAWFWGGMIMIISVALLFFLCVFYCCVCCCVCCKEESYNQKSYKRSKICCALFTIALIASSIVLLCVSLWLETEVDKGVMFSPNNMSNAISGQGVVETFEFYRFRVALGLLSVVLLVLLLSLFAFCCAPACKSPAVVVIFMFLHVLTALLLSVYAGATFTLIVFVSDLCVDIYKTQCDDSSFLNGSSIDNFCNGVVVDGFAIVMLSCATALILYCLQVFAAIYANLIRSSRYSAVETVGQSSEMFISTPHTVGGTRFHGGVWDAYGSQTAMGVKSRGQNIPSGYTPEAYPMGAVAPVAPIAPLPSDDYTGMKEITLRMQDIDADSSNDMHIVDV
ncbi:uncharacterized protein LOC135343263 [Halichondria panicea]|uniref:uncharacterized protein LOC135343263 n=1 Tax=Halichondria panicea TaxID=6063 RepID=UPI00312B9A7F